MHVGARLHLGLPLGLWSSTLFCAPHMALAPMAQANCMNFSPEYVCTLGHEDEYKDEFNEAMKETPVGHSHIQVPECEPSAIPW